MNEIEMHPVQIKRQWFNIKELLHRIALCGVVFFMLNSARAIAQINVQPGQTAASMAQKLAGQGVVVLNPVLTCKPWANGFFNVVSSGLGIDSGIVLTTGRAASALGVYGINGPSWALASMDNGAPGDSSLNILAGQQTKDACRLEFDVVPAGDTVSIDYIFSSEEYISAVCGPYNDAFAFFISGPGIAGADNMALVPGTAIPVTINSINNGVPGATGALVNCTSMGPGSPFTSYYRDNDSGTTLTHKGMTTVLQALHRVAACDTYHFRIVIADAGNAKYDSGVFLKAGSLKTGSFKVSALPSPVPDSSAVCIKGCLPGRFRVHTDKVRSVPQTIHYNTSGTAISGLDYAPLPDSVVLPANTAWADVVVNGLTTVSSGLRTLIITIFSPALCKGNDFAADSAFIAIYDTGGIAVRPADTLLCRGDSASLSVTGPGVYAYSWTPDAGLSAANVKEPMAAPATTTAYTVTAYIPASSCPLRTAVAIYTVRATPVINMAPGTVACYRTTPALPGAILGSDALCSYLWQGPDAFSSTAVAPVIPPVTSNGVYTLTVTNDTNGCRTQATFFIAADVPAGPVVITPAYYCLGAYPVAGVNATGHDLRWYDADTIRLGGAPVPPVDGVATFRYFVADIINDCESPLRPVLVKVEKCCDGDIFVPTAFSPNGDGVNDRFRPFPGFSYNLRDMEIFNRWGQVVYSSSEGAWDGRFGGMDAPAGTYFYKMSFTCITGGVAQRLGDFTLVR